VIEKNLNPIDLKYQKKIIGFIDGSLSTDDKAEFEAYVRTHPEFEINIKKKEDEILFLKSLIPAGIMSKETAESLNNEMKLSIFNLLRQEPRNFMERVKNSWEDWVNR
jgi:hypothetical protein